MGLEYEKKARKIGCERLEYLSAIVIMATGLIVKEPLSAFSSSVLLFHLFTPIVLCITRRRATKDEEKWLIDSTFSSLSKWHQRWRRERGFEEGKSDFPPFAFSPSPHRGWGNGSDNIIFHRASCFFPGASVNVDASAAQPLCLALLIFNFKTSTEVNDMFTLALNI